MDKYHIYEEVGNGTHSQVFKGRQKMGIVYVAIKRVEKCMMSQVVNEVQVRNCTVLPVHVILYCATTIMR